MSKLVVSKSEIKTAWKVLEDELGKAHKSLVDAGKQVAFLLDNDPEARDTFKALGITPATYTKLEAIGRGRLLPELADVPHYGRLPIDQQRRLVEGTVTAVIETAKGLETLEVDVLRADPVIRYRVLASDHIRTPSEQRIMIERNKASVANIPSDVQPWHVSGKTIVFRRGVIMTRADMLSALSALEKV